MSCISESSVYDYEYERVVMSISEAQEYFSEELNTILSEENLAYNFVNGQFQRRGRVQTQVNIQRVGSILADTSLA